MATTVVKTIGTGGDYTTLQAWEDASPASLVTADQVWQGQLKNQEFSAAGLQLTISGATVDATRYAELTTEAGASFLDHANVRTNALRYNSSNGAAIKMTGAWSNGVSIEQAYTRISKLQFAGTNTGSSTSAVLRVNADNCNVNQCIVEASTSSTTQGPIDIGGASSVLRNSLVIQTRNNVGSLIAAVTGAGQLFVNTTFVSTQATLTAGISAIYGTTEIKNCYVGNVVAPLSGGQTPTKTNCYCSAAATGFSVAAFSTATFENITDGTHDFRLKAGSALIDAGTTDSTNAPNDITGLARSGTWDVGAWESASGVTTHTSTGALASGAATIAGTAAHLALHTSTGALAAAAATIAGAASRSGAFVTHTSTGALAADAAAIAGTSSRSGASVTHTSTGALTASAAAIAGTASHVAAGQLVTDVLINNTGTVLASEAVYWSWLPIGRIGSLSAITPVDGTGTTSAGGTLTATGLAAGSGILLVAKRNTGAGDDYVYYQAGTVA